MAAKSLHLEGPGAPLEAGDPSLQKFKELLGKSFKLAVDPSDPDTGEIEKEHERDVLDSLQSLVKEIDKGPVQVHSKGNVRHHIQGYIAALDKQIAAELNRVMHQPAFTKLEGAWRGLRYLVDSDPYGETKIKVLNITKNELHDELAKNPGKSFELGTMYKKINEQAFGVLGGEPYGVIVGDFDFDNGPRDMLILNEMAQVAASAHCPFIAAASPKLLSLASWQGLTDLTALDQKVGTVVHTKWKEFRDKDCSRFVGLTMPRFLARRPYLSEDVSESGFYFEEQVGSASTDATGAEDSSKNFVWSNSAYVMGANLIRAFVNSGWCASFRGEESGGAVENLPCHTFRTADGEMDMTCPTEVSISGRRESKLSSVGLIPLLHRQNTSRALFMSGQSAHKPEVFPGDADATANANLCARLPYVFLSSRFTHYLKCIARDKIGSYSTAGELQKILQQWIGSYVADIGASPEDKLKQPLAFAKVVVDTDPEDPGAYLIDCFMGPHVGIETVDVKMHVVARLPREEKE